MAARNARGTRFIVAPVLSFVVFHAAFPNADSGEICSYSTIQIPRYAFSLSNLILSANRVKNSRYCTLAPFFFSTSARCGHLDSRLTS